MKFKCVSTHPEDLADGRILAPGEYADLDDEAQKDPHNQRLIEEDILIDASEVPDEEQAKSTSKKKTGGGES